MIDTDSRGVVSLIQFPTSLVRTCPTCPRYRLKLDFASQLNSELKAFLFQTNSTNSTNASRVKAKFPGF